MKNRKFSWLTVFLSTIIIYRQLATVCLDNNKDEKTCIEINPNTGYEFAALLTIFLTINFFRPFCHKKSQNDEKIVFTSNRVSANTRKSLIESFVWSVAETWTILKAEKAKIYAFDVERER